MPAPHRPREARLTGANPATCRAVRSQPPAECPCRWSCPCDVSARSASVAARRCGRNRRRSQSSTGLHGTMRSAFSRRSSRHVRPHQPLALNQNIDPRRPPEPHIATPRPDAGQPFRHVMSELTRPRTRRVTSEATGTCRTRPPLRRDAGAGWFPTRCRSSASSNAASRHLQGRHRGGVPGAPGDRDRDVRFARVLAHSARSRRGCHRTAGHGRAGRPIPRA